MGRRVLPRWIRRSEVQIRPQRCRKHARPGEGCIFLAGNKQSPRSGPQAWGNGAKMRIKNARYLHRAATPAQFARTRKATLYIARVNSRSLT